MMQLVCIFECFSRQMTSDESLNFYHCVLHILLLVVCIYLRLLLLLLMFFYLRLVFTWSRKLRIIPCFKSMILGAVN